MDLLSARQQKAVLSIVIAGILGTQLVVGVIDTGRWGWPMLAYPMYETAHFEGERLHHDFDLFAVFEDGTRVKIPRESLGLWFWPFKNTVVAAIEFGRTKQLSWVVDHACKLHHSPLTRLEVMDRGVAIAHDGPIYGLEPEIYASTDVTC